MKFYGIQKMTLLDFPERVACTLFTGGCNLRCPFCHNALLVTQLDGADFNDEEEILNFLKKRTGLLDGVCITGGEPLLQDGLDDFIRKVRALGFAVKLDTNGFFPEKLEALINENLLDYVAVDIKNSKEKYALTTGIENIDISKIEKTVSLLKENRIDYEFRTTVVKEFHTPDDIEKIAQWIQGAPRYFLQNFTDSGNLIGTDLHEAEKSVLNEMCDSAKKYVPNTQIRGI